MQKHICFDAEELKTVRITVGTGGGGVYDRSEGSREDGQFL